MKVENSSEKITTITSRRPFNILVISPFSEAISGNDEVLVRVMEKIDMDKFRFVVVQPDDNPYAEIYRSLGAEVVFIKMSIIKRSLQPLFITNYMSDFIPTVYRFIKLCRKYKIDIVHTNTTQIMGAGAAAKLLGLPSIYHAHSIIVSPRWVVKGMALWFKYTGDVMCANSYASAESYVKSGFPKEKVVVLGNPVPVEAFDKPELKGLFRKEICVGDSAPLIGIAGRVNREKKIEHFIKAASILSHLYPQARFIIIGGANTLEEEKYLDDMKKLADVCGVSNKIIFTGTRKDIPAVMNSLSVYAHARTNEGFGLVIAEAMATGVPVVAPATGGILGLVEDNITGFLVPPDDPEALAAGISTLLSNPDMAEAMGKAGKEKANRLWKAEHVADLIAQVYIKLFDFKAKMKEKRE